MELWGIVELTGCMIRINAEILKSFFFFAKIMVQLVFLPSKYLFPKQDISPNTGHMVWTFMIQQNDSCVSLGQYCNFAQYLYSLQEF